MRLKNRLEPQSQAWNCLCSRMRMVCVREKIFYSIYSVLNIAQILDGFTKEQPLFLSSGEWPDIAEAYSRPIDKLLDIIINVPASLARSNELMNYHHPEKLDQELANILIQFTSVIDQINIWHNTTKNSGSELPFRAVISEIHNPIDDSYPSKLFPFALEFSSLDTAVVFSFTWSVHLHILTK